MVYYWQNRAELPVSLNAFYESIGTSKQALHQYLNRQLRENEEYSYLTTIIHQIRVDHPTMNCRAMYHKIAPENTGRDRFEQLCKDQGFNIERPKNYRRTTNSLGVTRFNNLKEGYTVSNINQLWSSDITYFDILGTFCYITFILDEYSRRIVGYKASKRLTTEQTTLPALKMAIRTRGSDVVKQAKIIFHSDGGGQYYDKKFLTCTETHRFKNSMCEYAYQNGKAERINGVIKNNYLIHRTINSFKELKYELDRAVRLYNSDKPHKSLHYKTPIEYELIKLNLKKQKQSTTEESFDEKHQCQGASSPSALKQKQSQPQMYSLKNE